MSALFYHAYHWKNVFVKKKVDKKELMSFGLMLFTYYVDKAKGRLFRRPNAFIKETWVISSTAGKKLLLAGNYAIKIFGWQVQQILGLLWPAK